MCGQNGFFFSLLFPIYLLIFFLFKICVVNPEVTDTQVDAVVENGPEGLFQGKRVRYYSYHHYYYYLFIFLLKKKKEFLC